MPHDLLKTFELGVIAEIVHDKMNSLRTSIQEAITYPRFRDMPDWQQDQYKDGVQFVLDKPDCTPQTLHSNWHLFRMRAGWIWGHSVRLARQEHSNLIPWEQLSPLQQEKAVAFIAAVKDFQKNAGGFNEANRKQVLEIVGNVDKGTDLMPSVRLLMGVIDNLQALCGEFNIPHDHAYVVGIQQAVIAMTETLATADGLRAVKLAASADVAAQEKAHEPEKPTEAQAVCEDVASAEVEAKDVEGQQGPAAGTRPDDGVDNRSDAARSEDAGTGTGLLDLTPDQAAEEKGEDDANATD